MLTAATFGVLRRAREGKVHWLPDYSFSEDAVPFTNHRFGKAVRRIAKLAQ